MWVSWFSLESATHVADWANVIFIGSLVAGVLSTIAIVGTSNVKEWYWDKDRRESNERIAESVARQKEAELKLAELRRQVAARHLNAQEFAKSLDGMPRMPVEIMFPRDDGEAFQLALEIRDGLKLAKWDAGEPAPIPLPDIPQLARLPSAMSAGGQPSGVAVVAPWITQQESDELTNNAMGLPVTLVTPFLALHRALLSALGSLSASGGHLSAPPNGILRVVVGPHPPPPP
jgi:hypothetical protein